MLHLIALPLNDQRLDSAVKLINADDDVVFLDRGIAHATSAETLALFSAEVNLSVLLPDAQTLQSLDSAPAAGETVTIIRAEALLTLSDKHTASLSWYPDKAAAETSAD